MLSPKHKPLRGRNSEVYEYYEIREAIINGVKEVFLGFGFKQITTPIIDNYDYLSNSSSTVLNDEIVKFIGSNGEILALRPDVTIPIAKLVGRNQLIGERNLKFFYISKVFRMNKSAISKQREFTQAGIEYFGNKGFECDGEIIAIAINALKRITNDFKIEIGNPQFYKGLLEELMVNREKQNQIKALIERKNFMELEVILNELNIKNTVKVALRNIPKLYGSYDDVIKVARKLCLNDKMKSALEQITSTYRVLADYGIKEFISIDLGLINHMDYYTGVIFKGYLRTHGKEVLSGGRYDNLTKQYGYSTPACGFAINIEEMIKGVEQVLSPGKAERTTDYLTLYSIDRRQEAFNLSQKLREKGYSVETDILRDNLREQIETAESEGIKELFVFENERLNYINISKNTSQGVEIDSFFNRLGNKAVKNYLASIH